MLIFVITNISVSVVLYIALVKLRNVPGKAVEAIALVTLMVAFTSAITLLVPNFALSAIISNTSLIIIMTVGTNIKVKLLSLSAVYAIFVLIIVLQATNLISASLSLIYLVAPGFVPIGRYAVMDSTIVQVVYIVLIFAVSYPVSKKLGRYLHSRISVYDEALKRKLSTYLLFGALVTLFVFFVHLFLRYATADTAVLTLSYAVTLTLGFGYLMFAIFAFSDKMRMELDLRHKDELLQSLKDYTERVDSVSLELRLFRHDHLNLMAGFNNYVENQDWDGLKGYYIKYMVTFTESSSIGDSIVNKLNKIQIPEVRSILLAKCIQAQRQGIRTWVETRDSVTVSGDDILLDLCRIVGVLIDNALEACHDIENAEVRILAIKEPEGLLLAFENTCPAPPPIHDIFKKSFSTKGGSRGLGLYKASLILAQNDRITLDTSAKDGAFTQVLRIAE